MGEKKATTTNPHQEWEEGIVYTALTLLLLMSSPVQLLLSRIKGHEGRNKTKRD